MGFLGSNRFRWTVLVVVGSAVASMLPTLGMGLFYDDIQHRAFILEHLKSGPPHAYAFWNMFDIYGRTDPADVPQRIANGYLPWWTSPHAAWAFLRPLATLTHYVDYLLWPEHPWLMHVHGLVWYLASVLLALLLYRRWLGPGPGVLAALCYAVDESHAEAVAWVATRNTLMTSTFMLLTLYTWERWRRERVRVWQLAAVGSLLCAHASSEGAASIWPYLLGYTLFFERGPSLRARLATLTPLALMSALWIALATASGFVARGGVAYVDPRADPSLFVRIVGDRLPHILRLLFVQPPWLDAWLSPASRGLLIGACGVLLGVFVLLVAPFIARSPGGRLMLVGCFGSAVLTCTALVQLRLLLNASFGAHGLIALCVTGCAASARGRMLTRPLHVVAAGLLVTLHLPVAFVCAMFTAQAMQAGHDLLRYAGSGLGDAPVSTPMFVLNCPNVFFGLGAGALAPTPRPLYPLGVSEQPVTMARTGDRQLTLTPLDGYLLEASSQTVRDPREAFAIGDHVRQLGVTITVDALTPDKRPAQVRVEWDERPVAWVSWSPHKLRFVPVQLPPVGESLWLPGDDRAHAPLEGSLLAAFR